jgi:hypothetical protein
MKGTAEVEEPQGKEIIIGGDGNCTVQGCGCQAFVKAPSSTSPDPTCVGLNAAGGTCNHLMSQHN